MRQKRRERPEAREGETRKRGSEAPIQGRCGSRLRRTDPPRYCEKYPLKGRSRCQLHGGLSPRGPASPNWKHGQRSLYYKDLLMGSLLKGYLALQTDEEILSLQEQIRLWTGRERVLVERLTDHGESSEAWKAVHAAMREAREAERSGDAAKLAQVLTSLEAIATRGVGIEAAWRDLDRCHETLRKLKEAERKKVESDHAMLSMDRVVHLAGMLTALALKCITEDTKREEFAEGVHQLSQGKALELGPGVELRKR